VPRSIPLAALLCVLALATSPAGAEDKAVGPVCGITLDAPFASAQALETAKRVGPETYIEAGLRERGERWQAKLAASTRCPEALRAVGQEPDLVLSVRSASRTVRAVSFRPLASSRPEAEAALSASLGPPATSTSEHAEWHQGSRTVVLSCYVGESCWVSHISTGLKSKQ
jgi:hypothetical protein